MRETLRTVRSDIRCGGWPWAMKILARDLHIVYWPLLRARLREGER